MDHVCFVYFLFTIFTKNICFEIPPKPTRNALLQLWPFGLIFFLKKSEMITLNWFRCINNMHLWTWHNTWSKVAVEIYCKSVSKMCFNCVFCCFHCFYSGTQFNKCSSINRRFFRAETYYEVASYLHNFMRMHVRTNNVNHKI